MITVPDNAVEGSLVNNIGIYLSMYLISIYVSNMYLISIYLYNLGGDSDISIIIPKGI
jgi:hypothetical protein